MALCKYTFEQVAERFDRVKETQGPIITLFEAIEGTDNHVHAANHGRMALHHLQLAKGYFDCAEAVIVDVLDEMINEAKDG